MRRTPCPIPRRWCARSARRHCRSGRRPRYHRVCESRLPHVRSCRRCRRRREKTAGRRARAARRAPWRASRRLPYRSIGRPWRLPESTFAHASAGSGKRRIIECAAVDPLVVAAMLAASLLHASWHALIKVSSDRVLALAGMNLVSGAIALSLLPFSRALPAAAFLVIALSVLLHAGYKIALARLYGQAELGQAYPLARGLTPIIATGLSVALLGDILGTATLAAIAVICAGLLMLAAENRSPLSATAAGSAALVGLTVAAYSAL